ncbi:hypothetical protein GYMLUDRAFT_39619 [Collybiopsis luxurians FD-317 M1]|nr:hypothetical protein GYMLUDRAFT_39619 [Collybiopsis luxurians FD-317 M1]
MSIDTVPNAEEQSKPNIVVVGGSYVGSKVVDDLVPLVHETHNIILVEKSTHFQNIFAFPRLHAVSGFEHKAFVPYTSEYFQEAHNNEAIPNCTRIVTGFVTSILPDKVVLKGGDTIPYEYLILATGTSQRVTVGSETLRTVEQIEGEEMNDKQKGIELIHAWQTDVKQANSIVVVGGGAYGVQLVTDIKTHQPTLSKKVTLVHSRPHLLHTFHHSLHEIAMRKMQEFGVETILGQRAVRIEKVETVVDGSHMNGTVNGKQDGKFIVHLTGGGQLRADLVITCLGGAPLSEPLRTLAPSAIDSQTGYIRVLPTLQIDTSEPETSSSSTACPNVFALGDVAHTGAHKAARPGHFQSGVVTRNIQRLIKSKVRRQAREKMNGSGNCVANKIAQITKGISQLGEDKEEILETYTAPDVFGIHLRLGLRDSLIFRNPAPGSDTPDVQWDEPGSITFDCGCERYWKRRAETLWKRGELDA